MSMATDTILGCSDASALPNARALKKYQKASSVKGRNRSRSVVPKLATLSDRLVTMILLTRGVVRILKVEKNRRSRASLRSHSRPFVFLSPSSSTISSTLSSQQLVVRVVVVLVSAMFSSPRLPRERDTICEKWPRTLSSLQACSTRVLFPALFGPEIGSMPGLIGAPRPSSSSSSSSRKATTRSASIWQPNMHLSEHVRAVRLLAAAQAKGTSSQQRHEFVLHVGEDGFEAPKNLLQLQRRRPPGPAAPATNQTDALGRIEPRRGGDEGITAATHLAIADAAAPAPSGHGSSSAWQPRYISSLKPLSCRSMARFVTRRASASSTTTWTRSSSRRSRSSVSVSSPPSLSSDRWFKILSMRKDTDLPARSLMIAERITSMIDVRPGLWLLDNLDAVKMRCMDGWKGDGWAARRASKKSKPQSLSRNYDRQFSRSRKTPMNAHHFSAFSQAKNSDEIFGAWNHLTWWRRLDSGLVCRKSRSRRS
ncbi:hypothetical protein EJB05_14539, partial [Eragrostis curvula]